MAWALQIAKTELTDPTARHVLLCLGNYASADGRGAYPSAKTLSEDTGLSERTIRYKLDALEVSGYIVRGNQALAAVYIERHDRRPVVYDLQLVRGANAAPRSKRGANDVTGCNSEQNGVHPETERGAPAAPNTSLNHQVTEQLQQREISDVIDEQDRKALEPFDDRQRFAMFATWEADEKGMSDQIAIAGLPPESATEDALKTFKGFFVARPSVLNSSAGWCFEFVKWIKRQRVQAAASPAEDGETVPGNWAAKGVVL
jgi:hypothetical protein